LSAEFFAPLIGISPFSRLPPRIRILSIVPLSRLWPLVASGEQARYGSNLVGLLGLIQAKTRRTRFGRNVARRTSAGSRRGFAPLQVLAQGFGAALFSFG